LGNQIGTYSGTAWSVNTFTEKSVAVPSTTSTPFDVFIVDGTLALETVNWTNDTTRATALVLQDGIYVKSGATTRRYLGTCRTTTVSGQCEDSAQKRFVWNYYNRVNKTMQTPTQSGGASWTYTTNTMRQANGSTTNQVDFVIGINETPVIANLIVGVRNNTGNVNLVATIGLDSTTSNSAQTTFLIYTTNANNDIFLLTAQYNGYTGIGRHYLAWLEVSQAVGTTTWIGNTAGLGMSMDGNNGGFLSGITAAITC
jgi:hypothetical protein